MIRRAGSPDAPTWPEVPLDIYKDEPGTWMQVSRRVLFESDQAEFQVRYFELAPGGYTSHEKHEHEHCVVVLRGVGKVLLDDAWHEIGPGDVVHVMPNQPHQFVNNSEGPFGIVCTVNRDRDRPILLGDPPSG